MRRGVLTQSEVCDNKGEDEDAEDGKRDEKHVEITVVTPADAVSHPRTVVVKLI